MTLVKRVAAVLLALYIVVGPAFLQLGWSQTLLFQTWQMYSTVGLGAPYGEFKVKDRDSGRVLKRVSATHVMGIDSVRDLQPYPGSGDIEKDFRSVDEFRAAAEPLCGSLDAHERLIFKGRVAGRTRWQAAVLEQEALC